jgi:hypothetical protein
MPGLVLVFSEGQLVEPFEPFEPLFSGQLLLPFESLG